MKKNVTSFLPWLAGAALLFTTTSCLQGGNSGNDVSSTNNALVEEEIINQDFPQGVQPASQNLVNQMLGSVGLNGNQPPLNGMSIFDKVETALDQLLSNAPNDPCDPVYQGALFNFFNHLKALMAQNPALCGVPDPSSWNDILVKLLDAANMCPTTPLPPGGNQAPALCLANGQANPLVGGNQQGGGPTTNPVPGGGGAGPNAGNGGMSHLVCNINPSTVNPVNGGNGPSCADVFNKAELNIAVFGGNPQGYQAIGNQFCPNDVASIKFLMGLPFSGTLAICVEDCGNQALNFFASNNGCVP